MAARRKSLITTIENEIDAKKRKDVKDVERKRLRDAGKAYINRNGCVIPDRKPPTPVKICKCNLAGCSSLTEEQKMNLFNDFYSRSYDEQSSMLCACMQQEQIKRRTTGKTHKKRRGRGNDLLSFRMVNLGVNKEQSVNSPTSGHAEPVVPRKQMTYFYSLLVNGSKLRVCKITLCDVYSVSYKRIQNLQVKMKNGIAKPKDGRGKHTNRPHTVPDTDKDLVRKHISTFPTEVSHYSRDGITKRYVSSTLSATAMHRLFQEKHPGSNVKVWLYKSILHEELKLTFGQPRSDTCNTCDKLYAKLISYDDIAANLHEDNILHHTTCEEKAYEQLHEDICTSKTNGSVITLCMDLQRVIFLPMLTNPTTCQRLLSCFNCAVHDPLLNHVTMHVWNETIAPNGPMDIASCVLHYIVTHYGQLEDHQERKLILWADRCIGQNNNWHVISLFLYLITRNYFTTVEQKFFVGGHSFLPCDRDFALIERRLRTSRVLVPAQLDEVIRCARPSCPFDVYFMVQGDFKDFGVIERNLKKHPKCKITNASCIKLCAGDPANVQMRETHSVLESWKSYSIVYPANRKGMATVSFHVPDVLPMTYNAPLPLIFGQP